MYSFTVNVCRRPRGVWHVRLAHPTAGTRLVLTTAPDLYEAVSQVMDRISHETLGQSFMDSPKATAKAVSEAVDIWGWPDISDYWQVMPTPRRVSWST